jgi:hypothetical protein
VGPTPQELERIAGRVLALPNVKAYFGRSRYRLLTIEALPPDDSVKSARTAASTQRFRATIYDDTRQRTVFADGLIARPSKVTLTESSIQPPVTAAEFAEAVRHVTRDHDLGATLRSAPSTTYAPMPPLVPMPLPDGRSQRVISVGLLPGARGSHEIVGVDAASGALHRFADRAPPGARADADGLCGAPVDANQTTADRGTAGQAWITVTQAGKTLWKFLVVRPAASSGTNGSGVELRVCRLSRQTAVVSRTVPILNVKYHSDVCGPYRVGSGRKARSWRTAPTWRPARLCSSPARPSSTPGPTPAITSAPPSTCRAGSRARQRVAGGLVSLYQSIAIAPTAFGRVLPCGGLELMCLQCPPPSCVLAVRFRFAHARQQCCARVQ